MDTYAQVDPAAFGRLDPAEIRTLLQNVALFMALAPTPQQSQELARRLGNLVRSAS